MELVVARRSSATKGRNQLQRGWTGKEPRNQNQEQKQWRLLSRHDSDEAKRTANALPPNQRRQDLGDGRPVGTPHLDFRSIGLASHILHEHFVESTYVLLENLSFIKINDPNLFGKKE